MSDSGPEPTCCHRCVSFIVTSGFTALFLWLTFRVTSPTCSIEQFDAFALQKPPTTNNQTIHYDLKLKNRNSNKGIYYDTLNLTFYYKKPDRRNATVSDFILLGNSTFGHFYQGHQKSTHRFGDINATRLFSEKNVVGSGTGSGHGSGFRVELETAVRYKVIFWKTKRHRLVVGAELGVDGNGSLVRVKKNKGIKLIRSGVGDWKRKNEWFGVRGILGILILVLFW